MELGIAITTHSGDYTKPGRYAMINNCFRTLSEVAPKAIVHIISDGITERHRKIINGYPQFRHIERSENGGIAKAKNTCIQSLLDEGVEIGFLLDDDLVFQENIFIHYAMAILRTGIPHFCYFEEKAATVNYKGVDIRQTSFVMGSLLTFTRELIEKVGYFKVFDYKYGHEHSNFSRRCLIQNHIPFFCDIPNSYDMVRMDFRSMLGDIGKSMPIDWARCQKNEEDSMHFLDQYVPFID